MEFDRSHAPRGNASLDAPRPKSTQSAEKGATTQSVGAIRKGALMTPGFEPQRLCTKTPAEYVSLTVLSSPSVISTNNFSSILVACFMR
ncbi:hypothetical protein SAMN05216605_109256 [Pseudomonas abietaniphila]|uniref:Uncharacterized protein n=1 Tax=Pseudomonas abietaniphila TaxID=89065 RepID=A0A1G8GUT9_9PSED|nr:hypothetical protein SAMN05216605_109256 [Pseudomonas abietaniphila]